MSFQQGLSGLNAASQNLEAIGNNVANAATVGFKASQAQFADVFASSLTGAGTSKIGIGTKVGAVVQQFTQGTITSSNNPLDVAINGGGFFRLSTNGSIAYSRNGQFQLDKNGFMVNANGAHLTGYVANAAGVLSTGAPTDIHIATADLPPNVTTAIAATLNLDSRSLPPVTSPFDPLDSTTYTNSTSVSVYDSLGNSHILQTYFVNTAAGTWDVYDDAATNLGTLTFDANGIIDTALTTLPFTESLAVTTGATTPLVMTLDYTGTSQFGSSFSVNAMTQDGYASGRLTGFNTGADGTILGRYTNGQTAVLAQMVLADFVNPNGLQPLGNNLWSESSTSGVPLVGTPTSGKLGTLQASAVEDSNVDLTAELVNMITAQRVYQANAQTIKTQDQVLQTLVNLR